MIYFAQELHESLKSENDLIHQTLSLMIDFKYINMETLFDWISFDHDFNPIIKTLFIKTISSSWILLNILPSRFTRLNEAELLMNHQLL